MLSRDITTQITPLGTPLMLSDSLTLQNRLNIFSEFFEPKAVLGLLHISSWVPVRKSCYFFGIFGD